MTTHLLWATAIFGVTWAVWLSDRYRRRCPRRESTVSAVLVALVGVSLWAVWLAMGCP